MAMWKYTINSGTALREAIEDGNTSETVKSLIACYKELHDKLLSADMEDYEYDILETIDLLMAYGVSPDDDDEDEINYYLAEFYDICDSVRAFVSL